MGWIEVVHRVRRCARNLAQLFNARRSRRLSAQLIYLGARNE
jgi:hypothetical protein